MPVAVVEHAERGWSSCAASAEARARRRDAGLRRREAEARCPGLDDRRSRPTASRRARSSRSCARGGDVHAPLRARASPGRLRVPDARPVPLLRRRHALAPVSSAPCASPAMPDVRVGVADGGSRPGSPRAAEAARRTSCRRGSRPRSSRRGRCVLDDRRPTPSSPICSPGSGCARWARSPRCPRRGARPLRDRRAHAPTGSPAAARRARRAHRRRRRRSSSRRPSSTRPSNASRRPRSRPRRSPSGCSARLEALGLACTRVMVEAETEHGERLARCWRHEGALTPAALAARVRWQLEGWLTDRLEWLTTTVEMATGGLVLLRLVPDEVRARHRPPARVLGRRCRRRRPRRARPRSGAGDARASRRGHRGSAGRAHARRAGAVGAVGRSPRAGAAGRRGGRAGRERPRGAAMAGRDPGAGAGAGVRPAAAGRAARRRRRRWSPCRGGAIRLRRRPACGARRCPAAAATVTAWAGPWAHDLRWWDRRARARRAYWQVLVTVPDGESVACLVAVAAGHAALEAIYD